MKHRGRVTGERRVTGAAHGLKKLRKYKKLHFLNGYGEKGSVVLPRILW